MQRVIEEMSKAKSDVERRLRKCIPEIIRECSAFGYLGKNFTFDIANLSDKVNQRLISLSDEIHSDIEERAKRASKYAEEEDEWAPLILPYITRQIGEEDMVQRLDKHCSTLRYFLEGWIAIGMVNKLQEYELTNNIFAYLDNPLASPLWQEALNAGYLSNAIRGGSYIYGKGNQRNVLKALTEIAQYAINEAFQYGKILHYGKMGAIGYRTYRASSFPCEHCDELTMQVWPLDVIVLPAHPRCVCYSRPIYREDNPAWESIAIGKGNLKIHKEVDRNDKDYKDIYASASYFANQGHKVLITPKKSHISTFDYDEIYGSLKGTPFYGKCPDFSVDGLWYEHEGYITKNQERALSNMLSRGLIQSNRLVIKKTYHTKRSLNHRIWMRRKEGQDIQEVWTIDENNALELIYKNSDSK